MKLTLDNDSQVFFYEQEYYVLSNFSAFRVNVFGREFDTAEHAYQWSKFRESNLAIACRIRTARSAHEAFKLAESNRDMRRKDWDDVKLDTMLQVLRAKESQHEYVRRKLLQTEGRELIENSWRDDFWGWGENRNGQNWLGRLWMEVRSDLLKQIKPLAIGVPT